MLFLILAVSVLGAPAASPAFGRAPGAPHSPAQAVAPQSLTELVAELDRNNPALQAAKREIDMRVARIAPAGALPDPVFTASTMSGFSRPPFFPSSSTPNAFRLLSVAQEVPYPGKRTLRTSVATADADAERANYESRRLRRIAEFKTIYLDYVRTVRTLSILAEDKALLEHLRSIAESQFSVGKGLQQDVVKAQLEISMLLERQTILQEEQAGAVAQLNALLNRADDAPPDFAVAYSAAPVPTDLAALQSAEQASDPALQRDRQLVERSQRALELARKEVRPDFRIGVAAQRYTGGMPWMYGVDFMVSLPIYASRRQQPMIREAAATLDASERMRQSTQSAAASEVSQAFLAARAADQLVALYTDSVLPQSRLALESSLAAYQVGTVDFLSVLTNYQAVLAAQLSLIEQDITRDQALVRLEPFVGVEYVK